MNSSSSANPPVTPRASATVILLREQAGEVQLLLTRRHQAMAFMGGLWVFPGGTLCPADASDQAVALVGQHRHLGPELRAADGTVLTPSMQQTIAIAACRETFEETAVLLALDENSSPCDAATLQRLQEQRAGILAQPDLFATFLATAGLSPALQQLTYWAHWVTPTQQPRRFDTRFFLARLPVNQHVSIDANEAVESVWDTPQAILDAANSGTIKLSPPTLYNVMDLAHTLQHQGSLTAVLTGQAQREIPAVMPRVLHNTPMTIVMPWDPEYGQAAPHEAPIRFPAYLTRLPGQTAGFR